MQASRLLISTLTAVGIVGLAGLAVAQSTTTTAPGATTTMAPGATTTTATETDAQRIERLRMERERMERASTDRERMNAPAGSSSMNGRSTDSPMANTDGTLRRDANGNLRARADRN